jgi:hypothetical protein
MYAYKEFVRDASPEKTTTIVFSPLSEERISLPETITVSRLHEVQRLSLETVSLESEDVVLVLANPSDFHFVEN